MKFLIAIACFCKVVPVSLIAIGNKSPDAGLKSKAILHQSSNIQLRTFSRTKTVKASPSHGLRKIWSVEIIRQSYGNFLNWISDLDCPFGDKSGTMFSRFKAFENLVCSPDIHQIGTFSRTKTVKASPSHSLRKIWSVEIIRQSHGNFLNWISDLDCPFGDKSGTMFSRFKAFENLVCSSDIHQIGTFSRTKTVKASPSHSLRKIWSVEIIRQSHGNFLNWISDLDCPFGDKSGTMFSRFKAFENLVCSPDIHQIGTFSRTKTVKASPSHSLRKIWSVEIIRQSHGNFLNWISDLDCPFGDKSGTMFSRFKAFENLVCSPDIHQIGTFSRTKTVKASPSHSLRKIWSVKIIRQSHGNFLNWISDLDCPFGDKSGTMFSRFKAFENLVCSPDIHQIGTFSRTKTVKASPSHSLRKIWSVEIIRQSHGNFLNWISDLDCPFGDKSGTMFSRFKAFENLVCSPDIHQIGTFSRTKTVKASPSHSLRKIWSVEIIRQSHGNFLNWISDLDCPFRDKSGTKFSRFKAFEVSP
ncbi:uncharacterized protein TNCV_4063981 [Trichonephila clavipes]|nr:uncharacterized protein TNCV_4063981 [Trichonephila clavipes]